MSNQLWLKNYPVRWNLDYPEISLYSYFKEANAQCGELIALAYYGDEITFRQMHEYIDRFAAALADLGVTKGDRVALMLPNCPEYVYAYYAALKLGAIVVQMNPMYSPDEVEFVLKDSEAKIYIGVDGTSATFQEIRDHVMVEHSIISRQMNYVVEGENFWFDQLLQQYPPVSEEAVVDPKEDVAVFQYTGGTTGTPKAAMLTHYNIVCNVIQRKEWIRDWINNKLGEKLTQQYVLAALPFYHSYGMTGVLNMGLTLPAGLIIMQRFDVETLFDLIDYYRPAIFPAVPTIYTAIINHPEIDQHDLSCLEICNSGGAPMPVEVMARFEEITGSRIIEGYGLSEASPSTHANPVKGIRKYGSIGFPYPDTDCKIVDLKTGTEEVPVGEEGELIIKGPQVMKGYLNRPEETRETIRDGWLYTGDIATMDSSGYFYIVDRKKDMVITGAMNVYPREVDEVLYNHPKVAEAITVGIPHDYYGEVLKAYVVLKDGENCTEEELLEYCSKKLAVYKLPRIIEFRKQLPKSGAGKLMRRLLLEEEESQKQQG